MVGEDGWTDKQTDRWTSPLSRVHKGRNGGEKREGGMVGRGGRGRFLKLADSYVIACTGTTWRLRMTERCRR